MYRLLNLENKGIPVKPGVLTDGEGKKTNVPAHDKNRKVWMMQYIQGFCRKYL
jgi:hypothetical protein